MRFITFGQVLARTKKQLKINYFSICLSYTHHIESVLFVSFYLNSLCFGEVSNFREMLWSHRDGAELMLVNGVEDYVQ